MAEVDPEALGRSGIDPETGTALSPTVRNTLIRSSINFDAFRKQKQEEDNQTANLIQNQQNAFSSLNSSIQSLRLDIVKLSTGLANIALLLQQDGIQEKNQTEDQQEKERLLAERKIRIGKENAIEQKIQNALTAPVEKLTPKVTEVFSNIGSALGILFTGWLTKQVVDGISASEENNVKRFNEIKLNIIKTFGTIVGGLFAIKVGFGLVKRTIGYIASGLVKLLIAKPLAAASSLIRLPGASRRSGTKPRGGGPGLIGSLINGVTGWMNWMNGERTDAVLAALTFVPGGGIFKGIRAGAEIVYTLDQIAEFFGLNLTGVNPKTLAEKKKKFEDAKRREKSNKPTTTESTSTSTSNSPTPTPPPSSTPTQSPESTSTKSTPSVDMINKFEMAWKNRNNPFARGRIEGAWNQMTPEQKQQAKDWAQSKGYDWKEMKLKESVETTATSPQPPTSIQQTNKPEEANISSAQISSLKTPPVSVGTLPDVKPSLTMIKTSNNQVQQPEVPLTNGSLSDVPLINSSNPNNFYVLYSQLSYNVVE